jgi:hypothetical protein
VRRRVRDRRGELLVQDGVAGNALTNAGYAYDPQTDTWNALPNANIAAYRFAGGLGFSTVGGNFGGGSVTRSSQVLAGWSQGEGATVGWLSLSQDSITLAPGASANVTVGYDASDAAVTQPGTYTASLTPSTDTPYRSPSVGVAMTVAPLSTWGKLAGTVRYADSSGALHPIAGAVVRVTAGAVSYTLHTDDQGRYGYWIDVRNNPLTVIAAKDGYLPQTAQIKLKKGAVTSKDWVLEVD